MRRGTHTQTITVHQLIAKCSTPQSFEYHKQALAYRPSKPRHRHTVVRRDLWDSAGDYS
jgi:hypothetical protein